MARHLVAALCAAAFLSACSFQNQPIPPTGTPALEAIEQELEDLGIYPTTDFSGTPPVIPSNTPEPTATSEIPWFGWPTPMFNDNATPIPYPVQPISVGDSQTVYVVLGSDWLSHRDSLNTDAFLIVIVGHGEAVVISLPRDLYVYVPGLSMSRINTAYANGGEQMVRDMILYNFGLPVDHYVYMEMAEFIEFIDFIGGVDVTVTANILDECADGTQLNYLEGSPVTMGGRTALCYSRARMASNDFDRMRRQQDVVRGVLQSAVQRFGENPATVVREAYGLFSDGIETDMTLLEFIDAGWSAVWLNPASLSFHVIQPPLVRSWIKPTSGAYLLLPEISIRDYIANAIGFD